MAADLQGTVPEIPFVFLFRFWFPGSIFFASVSCKIPLFAKYTSVDYDFLFLNGKVLLFVLLFLLNLKRIHNKIIKRC